MHRAIAEAIEKDLRGAPASASPLGRRIAPTRLSVPLDEWR
jgi:hypothetical protein